jgi:fermentation-respiration switch protein FrsA (DUF1100 family)
MLLLNGVKALAAFFFATYLLALIGLAAFQRTLQYIPHAGLTEPAEAGLAQAQDLRLATGDGATLVAWHIPAKEGRPLILYFHGNGGSLVDRVPRFRNFAARGDGVLAISYRGYGGSTGAPSQDTLLKDGETAWREALRLGYAAGRIVVMGESLGTGVATIVAAAHPPMALVLDSPFLSALDVAERRYPFFPVRAVMQDTFRSDLAIGEVRAPVLMIHAVGDGVIPLASARRLFDLANEPKTFIEVSTNGHVVAGLPEIFPRMSAWIDAQLRPGVKASQASDRAQ